MKKSSLSLPVGFWSIVGVKLVTSTTVRFAYAFLPAIARGLGVSLEAAGALTSARWIAGTATPVVVGVTGRENRRRVALTGLAMFVIGATVTAATGVFVGAVVGFALIGIGKPVFDTAAQAYVSDRVPYERRSRTLGLIETTWSLAFLVGAPLAGWLIQRGGWAVPFWMVAVLGAILMVPVARSVRPDAGVLVARGRIRWDRRSVSFLVATALIVGSVELVFISFAAWLEADFGFGIAALGLLTVGIGIGELLAEGLTVVATDRIGKRRAVVIGGIVAAASYVGLAVADTVPVAVGSLIVGVAAFEFAFVSSLSLASELQPGARLSFLSRCVVAQGVGRALSAIAGVTIFVAAGMQGVGLVAAVAMMAAAAVVHRVVGDPVTQPDQAVTS